MLLCAGILRENWSLKQPLVITIADLTVAVNVQPSDLRDRLCERYHLFISPTNEPAVTIDCTLEPGVQYIPQEKHTTWVSNVSIEGDVLHYESYREKGTLDLKTRQGQITLDPGSDIENFLRVVYAWLCLQHGSLLLHGAGVVKDGVGYVFFGPSGAGKSTTAGLAAETATVLSDDIVIVRRDGDAYRLCGVPFFGSLNDFPPHNMSVPLKGIYRLHQDVWHHVEPLSSAQAVAELSASAPFIVQHSSLGAELLATCFRLARKVPTRQLFFKRTPDFWKVIE